MSLARHVKSIPAPVVDSGRSKGDAVQVFKNEFSALSAAAMAAWAKIPPAIAGDCMNRQNVMAGRISPVAAGMRFVGQARTIASVAGDNAAMHTLSICCVQAKCW